MRSQHIGAICTVLALTALTCKGEGPIASGRGVPASLSVTPDRFYLDTGKTGALIVIVRDEQLNPLAADVSITSSAGATATVVVDTTSPATDGSVHKYVVSALSPGRASLKVTSSGLTDSSVVSVLPLAFNGVISRTTPKGGDTVVIRSTAVLKFNPAKLTVAFGGGKSPTILINTADSVQLLAPFSSPGP